MRHKHLGGVVDMYVLQTLAAAALWRQVPSLAPCQGQQATYCRVHCSACSFTTVS